MHNLKKVAEKHGWGYKVWTNADLSPETFPMTWDFIQISIRMGEELEQSRFAQVADLARLEILHRFGGVYLDSLFEIGVDFLSEIVKLGKTHDLIVANEDPCKLKCVGANDKKYMSNGFFACIPGCPTLKRLLNYDSLESIDFENVHINQTTGPYYFRSLMESKDKIFVIDTEKIYPFMVNDSKYRKAKENNCVTEGKVIHDCLKKKYPDSLAIYHSGFGGSWSW
jgi:mannosyltransferase OCH1-like enzyme